VVQEFKCTFCGSTVEEDESAIPKKDSRLMLAKFNEQMEKVGTYRNRGKLFCFVLCTVPYSALLHLPLCRRQCCGSGMFIPFIPDPNPGSTSKNFVMLTPKNCFKALGNMIWVVHPGSLS
jgi:hypothetical protein